MLRSILVAFLLAVAPLSHADTIKIQPSDKTVVVFPTAPGLASSSIAYGDGFQSLVNQNGGTDPTDLTGRYNVCVGLRCGTYMTTGMYNTGVGFEALEMCTTCKYNTGIGEAALIYNITGIGNTALGWKAGLSKQGVGLGNYNIFIGYAAGIQSSANNVNVVIGPYAASGPSFTGDQNVLIGRNAGRVVTTGTRNTCIGSDACYNLTSGSNNTIIGPCTTVPPTINNKVMICNGTGAVVWQSP